MFLVWRWRKPAHAPGEDHTGQTGPAGANHDTPEQPSSSGRSEVITAPYRSPPAWPSSPSRSCWAAGCRHRTAPPAACPGWRRWCDSRIPFLKLFQTKQRRRWRLRGVWRCFSGERVLRCSPIRRISHRMSVSWMLLRANGHSCLSSLLLFSRTNWWELRFSAQGTTLLSLIIKQIQWWTFSSLHVDSSSFSASDKKKFESI